MSPVDRSFTNMSGFDVAGPVVSFGTKFEALLANATKRPSSEIEPARAVLKAPLLPSPSPFAPVLTSTVV